MRTRVGSPGSVGGVSGRGRRTEAAVRRRGLFPADAFSLLEVMIALAIFFMAIFAILQSVSQSLSAARLLQQRQRVPDVSGLIAELSLTNKLEEGIVDGEFGEPYLDFTWTRETYLVSTNGLFQIDFSVQGILGGKPLQTRSSILMWRPDSPVGNLRSPR